MFCISCGSQNPERAKFCFKCGESLVSLATNQILPVRENSGILPVVEDPGSSVLKEKSPYLLGTEQGQPPQVRAVRPFLPPAVIRLGIFSGGAIITTQAAIHLFNIANPDAQKELIKILLKLGWGVAFFSFAIGGRWWTLKRTCIVAMVLYGVSLIWISAIVPHF